MKMSITSGPMRKKPKINEMPANVNAVGYPSRIPIKSAANMRMVIISGLIRIVPLKQESFG